MSDQTSQNPVTSRALDPSPRELGERAVLLRKWAEAQPRVSLTEFPDGSTSDQEPTAVAALAIAVAEDNAALVARCEQAEDKLDGVGPQISMGTAAGVLMREVQARKAAEARAAELEAALAGVLGYEWALGVLPDHASDQRLRAAYARAHATLAPPPDSGETP